MARIGVIGGSGLYDLEGINKIEEISLETPFGKASDVFTLCSLGNKELVFLPRHGRNHDISPSRINYQANIYGMKKLEVDKIISISACGSLKENLKPLDFVIPDQFVDRTNQARKHTFFDEGVVVHVSLAYPVCNHLSEVLFEACRQAEVKAHKGGVYLNMEGPQFSTLAESKLYRSWGMDIIGMTNMAEARLAREAEICYISLAAITDYDCWHSQHKDVTLEMVLDNLKKNIENSKKVLREFIRAVDEKPDCSCRDALKYAIVTRPEFIPEEVKKKLDIIIGKYL
ncbi:MAG: S-methyl-5'-thioadenosine phosphorylase [Candidatus Omnitrophica bacterium]|nr:S-methyl-5'-thioadenosine phosphorylase [Candidatus Omnitrophota bacterium]MDD5429245.1 S-methyl-5'-thioadenosine phosphorylase [Candidatus Omnitrophota bacterium]